MFNAGPTDSTKRKAICKVSPERQDQHRVKARRRRHPAAIWTVVVMVVGEHCEDPFRDEAILNLALK